MTRDFEPLNGTRLRSLVRADAEWESMVPESCRAYLEDNGLVAKIRET